MKRRVYRTWAGQPNGVLENLDKCIETVSDGGRSVLSHQCRRNRGYGPEGLYCKQHGKRAQDMFDKFGVKIWEQE